MPPLPTDIKAPSLGTKSPEGTLFFNGSSYSGADIKIIVHMYDKDTNRSDNIGLLSTEILRLDKQIETNNDHLAYLKDELTRTKEGTVAFESLNKRIRKALTLQTVLASTLDATTQEATRLANGGPVLSTKVLAEVQTISISSHRDKRAVMSCGAVAPKGYTRGSRMIAGSLVFTVFDEHVLYRFLEAHASDFDGVNYSTALLDQMPPVDISIIFANEYGNVSKMSILGVEFVNEGQTMSIEDILTENVVTYVARDFDPMRNVQQRKYDENSRMVAEWHSKTGSELILEDEFQNTNTSKDPFARFINRRNPYV